MKNNVIELNNIVMGYGRKVILQDVSLNVQAGEFVSIFGENGAGKTTLFKGILQLLPILNGSIKVLDTDVTNNKNKTWLRTQIGYVPQTHNRGNFPISVFDAALLGRWGTSFSYFKKPNKEDKKITEEILEIVGLRHLLKEDCRKLSGGQTQKLNIARALVRNPKILLLDEPTTHLDLESQDNLDNTIKEIRTEYDLSILMISHNHVHARQVSDRVVHLNNGVIHQDLGVII
ncbi:metal ABC transporter ATP-binding protein [Serpentinicella alkaliphila]|uniref:Iron complex transport system ATP-binding protein n=1 Tax=Serpentinicella alkaliphila TaxID=1734049 RepID=A0A4R2SYM7_9FIRM|nr:ATP-binding cassette domain-containing protein [Serpentinicella alkaliphila]QUH27030.1 ATP-binding cassette domain-containing protein [Serpentinicella alkaliphila]TCP95627.1 iron complex transport system ATP-binding protein [Serpentinicella alkaliphila]